MEKEISTLDLVIDRLKDHLPEYHYEVLQKEWQTLKAVVLAAQTNNSQSTQCSTCDRKSRGCDCKITCAAFIPIGD
jgi:hypothetical protein